MYCPHKQFSFVQRDAWFILNCGSKCSGPLPSCSFPFLADVMYNGEMNEKIKLLYKLHIPPGKASEWEWIPVSTKISCLKLSGKGCILKNYADHILKITPFKTFFDEIYRYIMSRLTSAAFGNLLQTIIWLLVISVCILSTFLDGLYSIFSHLDPLLIMWQNSVVVSLGKVFN